MIFVEPIKNMKMRHTNSRLHGRSLSSSPDDKGHNVFKGWIEWETNGHHGIGEAIDLICPGGENAIAIGDCEQIKFRRPDPKREHIFVEGENFVAVYAHINAVHKSNHANFNQGDVVGTVLASIGHLHFELWIEGHAVTGATPSNIRDNMLAMMGLLVKRPSGPRLIVAKPSSQPNDLDGLEYMAIPSHWNQDDQVIEVDTEALGHFIGKSSTGLPPFNPIRATFTHMGLAIGTDVNFDMKHKFSIDPRIYAFIQ